MLIKRCCPTKHLIVFAISMSIYVAYHTDWRPMIHILTCSSNAAATPKHLILSLCPPKHQHCSPCCQLQILLHILHVCRTYYMHYMCLTHTTYMLLHILHFQCGTTHLCSTSYELMVLLLLLIHSPAPQTLLPTPDSLPSCSPAPLSAHSQWSCCTPPHPEGGGVFIVN